MYNSSVLKKLLLAFFVVLTLLATIGYLYYSRLQRKVQKTDDLPYILESSALVYEVKNLGKDWNLFQETTIGKDFNNLSIFRTIQTNLNWLEQSGLEKNLIENLSGTISIHGLSENEVGYIFYLDTRIPSNHILLKFLETKQEDKAYKFGNRKYAGHTIIGICSSKNKKLRSLFFLKEGHYIIASFSELLLEDIARELGNKKSATFIPIKKTCHKQGNVYINFPKLSSLLRVFFEQKYSLKLGEVLARIASFATLEAKISDHHILLTGIMNKLTNSPENSHWIYPLTKQQPLSFTLPSYMPANSAIVQYYNIKNKENFLADIENPRDTKQLDHTKTKSTKSDPQIKNLLNSILKNEVALCTIGGSELSEELLVVEVKNLERAMTTLQEANLAKHPILSQLTDWSTIYEIDSSIFKHWLPAIIFSDFKPKFLTTVDNHIVISTTLSAVKHLKEAYIKGNTWSKPGSSPNKFLTTTLEHANFSVLINPAYAWPLISQQLKPAWKAILDKNLTNFCKRGYASLQLINISPTILEPSCQINLLLGHRAEVEIPITITPDTIATTTHFKAEFPIITKPFFVETHKSRSPYLLAQDTNHTLYFVDDIGKLVWKKKLEASIVTDIFTIDLYKNNKWQYLFGTSNRIHLLDYTSQEVKPYPQNLPQAGRDIQFNVVDYNGDKNYRIAITDLKGNMYLKDMQYRPLPGWNPKNLQIPFAVTPFHIRANKDYFVTLQTDGTLHALNRQGNSYPKFPIHTKEIVCQELIVKKGNHASDTQLIFLTKTGNLYIYNLEGDLQNTWILDKNAYTVSFHISPDIVNKQNYALLRQDVDKISILDEHRNLLFEKQIETTQPIIFQYYIFGSHTLYAITNTEKNETYIYNSIGNLINNLPINNSGKEIRVFFSEANKEILVYTSFQDTILKYQLGLNNIDL